MWHNVAHFVLALSHYFVNVTYGNTVSGRVHLINTNLTSKYSIKQLKYDHSTFEKGLPERRTTYRDVLVNFYPFELESIFLGQNLQIVQQTKDYVANPILFEKCLNRIIPVALLIASSSQV